jgi:signal peptidase I
MEILRKIYSFLLDSVQTFLIAAAVFLVIYMFLFRPFEVKGNSMFPNFHDGEYVLTNLIVMRFQNLKQGDVIVFKAPPDPEKDYIKRVIGLPGDKVLIKNGDVYLNGNLFSESEYLKSDVRTTPGSFLKDNLEVTVPSGQYFVMGDNRGASSDSREWGFVKLSEVIGKSTFVYWPITQMRLIKNPN